MLGMALAPPKGHSAPAVCGPYSPCPAGCHAHQDTPLFRQDTSVPLAMHSDQARGEVFLSPHSCAGMCGMGTALSHGEAQGQ